MISYNDIKQIFYAISWTPMETTRQYSWEMVKMVKIFVMQPMNLCINFLKKNSWMDPGFAATIIMKNRKYSL